MAAPRCAAQARGCARDRVAFREIDANTASLCGCAPRLAAIVNKRFATPITVD